MKIKELQKTVNVAWSPKEQHPIYLAAGTAAQQFDSNTSSSLEIYATNFNDPGYDLQLKASVPCQLRFQKVIWSPTGMVDGTHKNGLIVGGCEAGNIMIYSAQKMLANEESLLARQEKHTGAVTGMDFNPFQNNLLATCASESEIFIWDLNNTSTHMTTGTKTQPLEDVQNVAWNRQVQHVLASVFSSRCVIWDLRTSKQIIKLSDSQTRVRWHAIQWDPDVATQVWLASEDDQAPIFQAWDLRYAYAPAKTMQIHHRGILGMSLCPADSDIMVSCGKDNRILCWNPNTNQQEGELLGEIAITPTWYSDVKFCPRNPALIASSSLDGNVSIYSLFGGTQQQVETANKIADSFPGMDQLTPAPLPQQSNQIVYNDLKNAPKFLKRPNGVAFGFGGKLVSFNNKTKNVTISQVVSEPQVVERAEALERSLKDGNFTDYCREKADQMPDQSGRYLWYFIKANFENEPKEEMLNLLGFNREDIDGKFSKYINEDEGLQNNFDNITNRMAQLNHQPVDNASLMDNIALQEERKEIREEKAKIKFSIPKGEHPDALISEALLTGNVEAAVELCLDSQRIPEALIIASTAGIDFLTKIQNKYLEKTETDLSNIISALVTRDWLDFINRCSVESWKEGLVAVLKHQTRKTEGICERLGDRLLEEQGNNLEYLRNAILCYICAGSIDKVVNAWYKIKQLENRNANYKLNTEEIQELAEVVMLLTKAMEHQGYAVNINDRFADFVNQYSGLLVSQGALTAALSYILALGGASNHPDIEDLKQRINNTVNYAQQSQQSNQQNVQNSYGYNAGGAQQQQNIYGRQNQQIAQKPVTQYNALQQQRGSFSQTQPLGLQQQQPQASYPANPWNPPAGQTTTAPVPSQPGLYNPLQPPSSAGNPPLIPLQPASDIVSQPPRPASNASSQGGGGGGAGFHSRSKYVLDPSVAPSGPTSYGNLSSYNPPAPAPAPFNPPPFNSNPMQPIQPSDPSPYMSNNFNTAPIMNANPYGGPMIGSTMASQNTNPSIRQNMQRNPTPPPGWNDPPALTSKKPAPKPEAPPAVAPITHPLFGTDPNQNQNGYMDPNQYAQNQPPMGMQPPPSMGGNYLNPVNPQNNNMPPPPGPLSSNNQQQQFSQMGFQNSAIPSSQQQSQNQWGSQTAVGYTEQPAPIQRQPEPPKEKPPLPEEYIYMQTVLEELKNQCLNSTNDPRTKRKFVDVAKRLENLYDCLRDGKLTPATINALNQIVQCLQIGDYANALQVQTQIAFGTDFSQCAGFMPGLKVLVQSASELQVYLR